MSWRGAAPVDLHPRERHRPEVDLEDVVEKGSRPGLLPREDVHVLAHSDAGATRAGCAPPAALHRERHLLPGDRLALDPALEDLVEDLKCPARACRRRGLRVPVSAKAKAPLLPLSPSQRVLEDSPIRPAEEVARLSDGHSGVPSPRLRGGTGPRLRLTHPLHHGLACLAASGVFEQAQGPVLEMLETFPATFRRRRFFSRRKDSLCTIFSS